MDSKDIATIDIPTKDGRLKASGYVSQFIYDIVDSGGREPVTKIFLELVVLPGMELTGDGGEVVKLPIGRIIG